MLQKKIIGVIGLGYVGLPLLIEFSKYFKVIGFDKSKERLEQLENGHDKNLTIKNFRKIKNIKYSNKIEDLKKCNVFIITVPTPIKKNNLPDLSMIIDATKKVAKIIKKDDLVIYESTVYPGLTEEVCIKKIESISKLYARSKKNNNKYKSTFFYGYSPERINPGDKINTIKNIKKIISAGDKKGLRLVKNIYSKIIPKQNLVLAKTVRAAEAAKIIENTQRDVNIALINEFSLIFKKLNIKTKEVIDLASTKWNFNKFYPGLVGGHCIGVDPYYLAYKAKKIGYKPKMILAGRKINNFMVKNVFNRIINLMKKKKINIKTSKILIMGLTFKENVPDLRNSKSLELINIFIKKKFKVSAYDPFIKKNHLKIKKLKVYNQIPSSKFSAIIFLVKHDHFKRLKPNIINNLKYSNSIIFDCANFLKIDNINESL